jgi:hypothetical protein
MVVALRFVELIVAVSLIGRMRDINLELTMRVAHLTHKRPRSETLERLEQQLVLPLEGLIATGTKTAVLRRVPRVGTPPSSLLLRYSDFSPPRPCSLFFSHGRSRLVPEATRSPRFLNNPYVRASGAIPPEPMR